MESDFSDTIKGPTGTLNEPVGYVSVKILIQFLPLNTDKSFQIVCLVPLFTPGVHKDHVFDNTSKFFWGKRFALKPWDQGV